MHKFHRPVCVPVLLRQLTNLPLQFYYTYKKTFGFSPNGQFAFNSTQANLWKAGDIFPLAYILYTHIIVYITLYIIYLYRPIDELIVRPINCIHGAETAFSPSHCNNTSERFSLFASMSHNLYVTIMVVVQPWVGWLAGPGWAIQPVK